MLPAAALDLTAPSVQAALHFAQEHSLSIMRAAGLTEPNAEDSANLKAEFARLLWHVAIWDGGFLHGSDSQVEEAAAARGLSDYADRAMLKMGKWPVAERAVAV